MKRIRELINASGGLHVTFHRAFDWVKNPFITLERLEEIGVDTILSSGQEDSSLKGLSLLQELHEKSKNVTIMPGGGITIYNCHLYKEKKFKAIHLSASKFKKSIDCLPKVLINSPSFLKEDIVAVTNEDIVRRMVKLVK